MAIRQRLAGAGYRAKAHADRRRRREAVRRQSVIVAAAALREIKGIDTR
jgi:hypothetical protein